MMIEPSAFKTWVSTYYDPTLAPDWWKWKDWGPYRELWLLEEKDSVKLLMTKERIVSKVNEDPHGRAPSYHVWNTALDRELYCGPEMQVAYDILHEEMKRCGQTV